jgi:hypothetical protein
MPKKVIVFISRLCHLVRGFRSRRSFSAGTKQPSRKPMTLMMMITTRKATARCSSDDERDAAFSSRRRGK